MKNKHRSTTEPVCLAFNPSILETLMREGRLHATDFNCIDHRSKNSVWTMLRKIAASKLQLS